MMGHLGMVICLPYFQFVSPPIGGLTLGPIFMCVLMCLCFLLTRSHEIVPSGWGMARMLLFMVLAW